MSVVIPMRSKIVKHGFVLPEFVSDRSLFPFELTKLNNGWLVAIAVIDKTLADVMLELNAEEQRNARAGNITKFSRDMATGSWKLTHQGIAFDVRGRLFDGQNRLMAVSESDSIIESLVFFGAGGSDEMKVLDTGGNRNAHDAARVDGKQCSTRDIALIRQMCRSRSDNTAFTNTEILALMDKYQDAMQWLNEHFNVNSRYDITPVRAAVGRAYYNCDHDKLKRFVQIYLNEVGHDGTEVEMVPATLAKMIVSEDRNRGGNGRDLMARCLRAIQSYMDCKPITRFYNSPEYLSIYPLPLEVKPRS